MWVYHSRDNWKKSCVVVSYNKGKDNDATLRSKLISAYRKTNTNINQLGQDLQELKKKKTLEIYY